MKRSLRFLISVIVAQALSVVSAHATQNSPPALNSSFTNFMCDFFTKTHVGVQQPQTCQERHPAQVGIQGPMQTGAASSFSGSSFYAASGNDVTPNDALAPVAADSETTAAPANGRSNLGGASEPPVETAQ